VIIEGLDLVAAVPAWPVLIGAKELVFIAWLLFLRVAEDFIYSAIPTVESFTIN
jgi:hypothetical protein